MTDQQRESANQIREWLQYSPTPIFILLVAFVFGVYGLLDFEITVVMVLVLILREVARP